MAKINPNTIKARDLALVRLINGATKGGVQPDRKKEENKKRARKKVHLDVDTD